MTRKLRGEAIGDSEITTLNLDNAISTIPIGGVIRWSGNTSSLPTGFVLRDTVPEIVAMGWVSSGGDINTDRTFGFVTSSNIRSGTADNYEYTWTFETAEPDTDYFVLVNHQGGSNSNFRVGLAYTETTTSFISVMQDVDDNKTNVAHSVVVMRVGQPFIEKTS
jgi:hypothetical protein